MTRGRPTIPPEKRHSESIQARVTPASAYRFQAECQARGVSQSKAIRQALAMWMAAPYAKKNRSNQ